MLANNNERHQCGGNNRNYLQIYHIHGQQLGQQSRDDTRMERAKSVLNKWLKLNELGRLKRIRSLSHSE